MTARRTKKKPTVVKHKAWAVCEPWPDGPTPAVREFTQPGTSIGGVLLPLIFLYPMKNVAERWCVQRNAGRLKEDICTVEAVTIHVGAHD